MSTQRKGVYGPITVLRSLASMTCASQTAARAAIGPLTKTRRRTKTGSRLRQSVALALRLTWNHNSSFTRTTAGCPAVPAGGLTPGPAVDRPPQHRCRPTGRHTRCPSGPRGTPPPGPRTPPDPPPAAGGPRCLGNNANRPTRNQSAFVSTDSLLFSFKLPSL